MAKCGWCTAPPGARITHDCKGTYTNADGSTITCDCDCPKEKNDDSA